MLNWNHRIIKNVEVIRKMITENLVEDCRKKDINKHNNCNKQKTINQKIFQESCECCTWKKERKDVGYWHW